MSRSLFGFLLFCLLLLLASGGVVWYMGPTLAGIVVDSERRQNPYYLLQLLPSEAAAGTGGAPSYRSRFLTLAADDNGRLLWEGGSLEVAEGSLLLDVSAVQLVEFATGADLVQMLTGSDYRALERGYGSVRHVGTSQPPEPLVADAASVVVLYHSEQESDGAPLGSPGDSGWLALLPQYGGTVRWRASISSIRGTAPWNRLLVVQLSDLAAAEAWLADPDTVTERAIARKHVDEMVVLLVQPPGFAPR